jgi:amidohydrolase
MSNVIKELAEDIKYWLIELRRELHQYPELSFREMETAKRVAFELNKIKGIKVRTGKEETGLDTGVIAEISSGTGPAIAVRADMDALPIKELNDHSYASKNEGVMHACGHDAHTTIVLGVAKVMSKLFAEGKLQGTVKFIFQPAEEATDEAGSTGSPYMINAGALKDVDAAIALHMDPEIPLGSAKVHNGYSMACIDTFEAVIYGSGGHAAYPHHGIDPIWIMTSVLQTLYSSMSRKVSPLEPAIISVTNIKTPDSFNVIPKEASFKGTVRSYNKDIRTRLKQQLKEILAVSETLGGSYALSYQQGEPALYNDSRVTNWIRSTIHDLYPNFTIYDEPYGMGGEDFSYMAEQVPAAMLFIGASLMDEKERGLHTPEFDIDERVLYHGVAILAETASRYLKGEYTT